tara:strand:- start:15 stop:185 length:171 start_codon:yes stop_codon:yes gene_type:complete
MREKDIFMKSNFNIKKKSKEVNTKNTDKSTKNELVAELGKNFTDLWSFRSKKRQKL